MKVGKQGMEVMLRNFFKLRDTCIVMAVCLESESARRLYDSVGEYWGCVTARTVCKCVIEREDKAGK